MRVLGRKNKRQEKGKNQKRKNERKKNYGEWRKLFNTQCSIHTTQSTQVSLHMHIVHVNALRINPLFVQRRPSQVQLLHSAKTYGAITAKQWELGRHSDSFTHSFKLPKVCNHENIVNVIAKPYVLYCAVFCVCIGLMLSSNPRTAYATLHCTYFILYTTYIGLALDLKHWRLEWAHTFLFLSYLNFVLIMTEHGLGLGLWFDFI